jgi:heme/copper-type cytochrome/quinol oxidase subunit 2
MFILTVDMIYSLYIYIWLSKCIIRLLVQVMVYIMWLVFSVLTVNHCKYQVNNKTDKYILNILEHNHLQNTIFTLLQICIQEQHDIYSIS